MLAPASLTYVQLLVAGFVWFAIIERRRHSQAACRATAGLCALSGAAWMLMLQNLL